MSKINNIEFLTLPQQVGKNKRDIEVLDIGVQNLNAAFDSVVSGSLMVKLLNPNTLINITNYGATELPYDAQFLILEYIKENHSLTEYKTPLMIKFDVAGGVLPDVISAIEYNTLFSSTTFNYIGGNLWRFRAVGYSQTVRFEVYAEYYLLAGTFTLSNSPYVLMISTNSNNTFYVQDSQIVVNNVMMEHFTPSVMNIPCKVGDIVISEAGVYVVNSLFGNSANLTLKAQTPEYGGVVEFAEVKTNKISHEFFVPELPEGEDYIEFSQKLEFSDYLNIEYSGWIEADGDEKYSDESFDINIGDYNKEANISLSTTGGINIISRYKDGENDAEGDISIGGQRIILNGELEFQTPFSFRAHVSSQRPVLQSYDAGKMIYDATLKACILWNGTAWTNLDGTAL